MNELCGERWLETGSPFLNTGDDMTQAAGLASDLNRELDTLVAGTLQAANEYLAGMLLPHQQRIVDEKTELDDKLGKLNAFILTSPHFAQLQNEEKERLQRQFSIMRDYTSVLGERIDALRSSV